MPVHLRESEYNKESDLHYLPRHRGLVTLFYMIITIHSEKCQVEDFFLHIMFPKIIDTQNIWTL